MKFIYLIGIILIPLSAVSQVVRGKVEDENHQGLIGATVQEIGTQNGVTTDLEGHFKLKLINRKSKVIVSFLGYKTDTIRIAPGTEMHIDLEPNSIELGAVSVSGKSTFRDKINAKQVEVITASELNKAACCNLSESFQTNASVDVSFSDAVTGAKTIRMLGLDGRYVQINRENITGIRGLMNNFGLESVPGTWIQSIDVGKGAGSILNGYESMTGQINLELKKPEFGEKLLINTYANSFGRFEINGNTRFKLSKKINTGILFHTSYLANEIDNNDDGFMDLPKSKQISFLNRYKYNGKRMESQLGFSYLNDERAGGQLGFNFGDNSLTSTVYGFSNKTQRGEVFGKIGVLFPASPQRSIGGLYSAALLETNAGYGRKKYLGQQKTGYINILYQDIIVTKQHSYKVGASYLYDDYNEELADIISLNRTESVPGISLEYTYKPSLKTTILLGGRSDFHNLYGTQFTPRLHLRHEFSHHISVRATAGKGFRTANAISENNKFLVSGKKLILREKLLPEKSWNFGISTDLDIHLGEKELEMVLDFYHTNFINQAVFDRDRDFYEINVYNLKGKSYANSFQAEIKYEFNEQLKAKTAYKFYDVKTAFDGILREVPLIPKHRFFVNTSYSTKSEKWKADATLQWTGAQRLIDLRGNGSAFSDDFFNLNMHFVREFRWGNIYAGGENLLNYRQKNPILGADEPFGKNFDASMVWAPIAGRLIYVGLKFKIKK